MPFQCLVESADAGLLWELPISFTEHRLPKLQNKNNLERMHKDTCQLSPTRSLGARWAPTSWTGRPDGPPDRRTCQLSLIVAIFPDQ